MLDPHDVFIERLPHRPYCTDDPTTGLKIRPALQALDFLHIQPNRPLQITWLVFDLDFRGAAFAWKKAKLARPSIIAINPKNDHAHLFYGLTTPVTVSDAGRKAPIRYAESIQSAYSAGLNADPGYAGVISKNPMCGQWPVIFGNLMYDLSELAECCVLPKRIKARAPIGLGRNSMLFDELRAWTYQWVREFKKNGASPEQWAASVLGQAERMNAFETPLAFSELKAIARSVSKWSWREFSEETFSAIQSARGKRGGRPRTTTLNGAPWESLCISRATYYRNAKTGLLLPA